MQANNGKTAEPETKVGTWKAARPRAGKGKGGGEEYVNRTGNSNVHVNVTVPEAPRSYSTDFPNRPNARVPICHDYRVKRNHNKSPKGRNKPRRRVQPTAGRPSSFCGAVIDGVNNAVSHPQVKALRNLAGVVRDGVLCMHFALYLTVMCMMAAVMHYVYSVASVMLAGEVRARLLTFGIGLMPGLVVHLCPSLTRISVRVQSTWNALVRGTDHLVAANGVPMWNNAAGNDGGRHNMDNARNFAIHRPPVMNRFWLLVLIALASLFSVSNALAPTTDLDVGAWSAGAMGLAGMEYSNASIARTIETLLDSGASRIMLHDETLFTNLGATLNSRNSGALMIKHH